MVAGDVLPGGVALGRRIVSLRMYAQVICIAVYGKPNQPESYYG